MKLHKLDSVPANVDAATASLAEKYLGRMSYGSAARDASGRQIPLAGSGKYPPSRDGEFTTMRENEKFADSLAKGGHGAPLSVSRSSRPSVPATPLRLRLGLGDGATPLVRIAELTIYISSMAHCVP